MTRVLLLAGTGEARAIAAALRDDAGFEVLASLAGATTRPADLGVPVRSGGFGGPEGLRRFIAAERIDLLVDATHPFAAQMKRHAAAQSIPVCHVIRPGWPRQADDRWTEVASLAEAARALPGDARALLALGQRHLGDFRGHHATLFVRSLEQPPDDAALPGAHFIIGGPGPVDREAALLRSEAISHLVCRNAGGPAGHTKIEAARRLGVPVIMVRQPDPPDGTIVETPEGAVAWCIARRDPR
ncbi:cobalt-precorrin-6A reductase [Minwuia sp.]|uniref:cobalt-precorrin-6A reductase n=1 Tax=Minwuia sp. TaxID=2493630 RepID=UPI003A91165B